MNKFFKIVPAMALALGSVSFTACGDDASSEEPVSDVLDLKADFEIVLNKAKYEYNAKDSSLIFKEPVCKQGTLGNLVWQQTPDDPDTSVAYVNKSTVTMKTDDGNVKFAFDGSKFPAGLWMDQDYSSKSIQNAYRFTGDNIMKNVFRYEGDCFLKDVFSSFRSGNPALEEADSVLTAFYMDFKSASDTVVDETEMLRNIRVPDCNEMYLYDNLVKIRVDTLTSYSGKITVSYGSKSCPLNYKIRYAFSEADCKAAFADFEDDKNAAEEFDFDNYWRDVDFDEYCIEELILAMKKAEGIPLKSTKVDSKRFATTAVDAILNALK